MTGLPSLRWLIRWWLSAAGLPDTAADTFTLAAHEASVNAAEHGGGGRLWLWRHDGDLWCEISDDGGGLAADRPLRTERPGPGDAAHVGL